MNKEANKNSGDSQIRRLVREHLFKYGIAEDFLGEPEHPKKRKKKK